ncbi:glycosyltransferase family 2 protein [Robbsia sp. KACC 23696]|uniref:glycosyltransferase n=1 Tax=Robbsia sp. KACC 23696 TaxID=3149231 RepID=UPI00325B1BCE
MKIACILPTFNAGPSLDDALHRIINQSVALSIFVVDSSSTDETQSILKQNNIQFYSILSKDFNHGGTRQSIVEKNSGFDIYIFVTQDALLNDQYAIENIVKPFSDPMVGAVCGRQIPHDNADRFASHARLFNYPNKSFIRDRGDIPKLGLKAAFMSNSFAAYRSTALTSVGGFPSNLIFGEDMYVAAKLLLDGWKISYESSAICKHSHNYSLEEEFRRYFDMGVFHARESWISDAFGSANNEGKRFVRSELKYVRSGGLAFIFKSMIRTFVKLLGYKIGKIESKLPIFIKKKIGMHRRYWVE